MAKKHNIRKVCLLAPVPPPAGGIATWTKRMMQTHLKNGWKVVIVDEQVIFGRTNFGEKSKPVFFLELIRCLKIWKDLVIRLCDKDVLVVQSCISASTGGMLRELFCCLITHIFRRKFIVHFRCTVPNMVQSSIRKRIFRFIVHFSDYIILLNQQSAQFISEYCTTDKYCIVPNFVDENELKTKQKLRDRIQKALYAGGVIKEKGCSLIVEVAREMPEIEFHLIGKIGMETNDATPNVIFHGEQNKEYVETAMQDADVFLFLSHFAGEGFSNSLAEAMATSMPCIVTDWAANKDMIETKGGITVSPDCRSVVDALNKMQDKLIRKEMGDWNYSKVSREYSIRNVTGQYVDIYEHITNY